TAVRVMKTRTDKVPNTSATAASSGADLNGAAVKNACDTLRDRLAEIAATMWSERAQKTIPPSKLSVAHDCVSLVRHSTRGIPFGEVVERAYMTQVSLSANGFYRTPGLAYDKPKGHGIPFYYFAYGVAVTQVEVDGLSGMKRVERVDILHDVGDSLNEG